MSTNLQLGKDINGNVTTDFSFTDENYAINLAASTSATLTIPEGFNFAEISSTNNIEISTKTISAAPTATFEKRSGQLNANRRTITGISELHFYAFADCYIYVSLYK